MDGISLVLVMRNNKYYYSSNIDCTKMLLVCVKKGQDTINIKKDKKHWFWLWSIVTIMQWTEIYLLPYCFSKLLPVMLQALVSLLTISSFAMLSFFSLSIFFKRKWFEMHTNIFTPSYFKFVEMLEALKLAFQNCKTLFLFSSCKERYIP